MASSSTLTSLLLLPLLLALANATTFDITNQCTYTVWAASVPGGGQRLDSGQTWTINVNPGTNSGRVWARTGCNFDASGNGGCTTGDCRGLLACQAYGTPPNTIVEYALNQSSGQDFYDISLVHGFNVPMDFTPTSGNCHNIQCSADVVDRCPVELKANGGCNNPCAVFKTDEYCCTSGSCGPTIYSRYFKKRCLDAYSYPKDDATSTFTCPSGTNYKVTFCPSATTTFDVINKCAYTIWAAGVPGGGTRLNPGQTWTINVNVDSKRGGRIWARTGCNFNASGHGSCTTGDCGGLLACQAYGTPPNTLAEYHLNHHAGQDNYDISLVNGFNVPMDFMPTSGNCDDIQCTADLVGQCPAALKTNGGCNNPCTVFKTDEYCCNSGSCGPTDYSRYFKNLCPDAYSYPKDDAYSSCPSGTNYKVTFCPRSS